MGRGRGEGNGRGDREREGAVDSLKEVLDSEATAEGWDVSGVKAILDGVVGGDDEATGADVSDSALNLGGEGVVVRPLLEVLGEGLGELGVEIVDEDGFLVSVTVPPLVCHLLEEGLAVPVVGEAGLSSARGSPDPEVVELSEIGYWALLLVSDGLEVLEVT